MKKVISFFLLSALLTGVLAGCTAPSATPAPTGAAAAPTVAADAPPQEPAAAQGIQFPLAEPVNMTMFAIINGEVALSENKGFQYLQEKTNVIWDVQSAMGVDLGEKRNLLLASNQYPDVFMKAGMGQQDLDKYGAQGIFIPLNDLIEQHAPNLSSLMEKQTGVTQLITSLDGNIYSLPEISEDLPGTTPYFINRAWLDTLGLTEPANLEELYNVLKAFKEQDPNGNGKDDEIPFIFTSGDVIFHLLPYFGIPVNVGSMTYETNNGLEFAATTEAYKEFINYLTRLYNDGLMDKNSFTYTGEQKNSLGMSGDILGSFFDAGAFLTVGRDRDEDYIILTPFAPSDIPVKLGAVPGTFVVTDLCKTPDVAVAWADYLYSEEGARLAWMGIEGESYRVNDDGTWDWLSGEYADITTARQHYGIQGAAHHPSAKPELWFTGITDPDEKYLIGERERIVGLGGKIYPTLMFGDADTKTLASISADISPYLQQYIAKVVTGELTLDASWEEYTATLNNMGLSQMMELYNKAYTAAMAQ